MFHQEAVHCLRCQHLHHAAKVPSHQIARNCLHISTNCTKKTKPIWYRSPCCCELLSPLFCSQQHRTTPLSMPWAHSHHFVSQKCIDCGSDINMKIEKGWGMWASVNNGVYFCMQCAGQHRGIGVQDRCHRLSAPPPASRLADVVWCAALCGRLCKMNGLPRSWR